MNPIFNQKDILLIDHQPYWREFSSQALQAVGFCVHTLGSYKQKPLRKSLKKSKPRLIVLGCSQIGDEEQRLIRMILDRKQHLLVLSTFLSLRIMRALFLQGVDDIIDKPYNAEHLVQLVNEVLANTAPRNSYQAVERADKE